MADGGQQPQQGAASGTPPWLGDTALRFAVVAALIFACLRIAQPFIVVLVWAVLLAVMAQPLHLKLRQMGLRNAWSATLLGVAGFVLLLVPAALVAHSVTQSALELAHAHQGETLRLPDLPWLAEVPLAGNELETGWKDIQADTPGALRANAALVESALVWLAARASGLAKGVLHLFGAIAIAAVLLAYGKGLGRTATAFVHRISATGDRGDRLIAIAIATIKSVMVGVIGMAIVQAVLIGAALFLLGVPFAGVLLLMLLVVGIVQIPSQLLTVPVVIWAWTADGPTPALIFAGWLVAVAAIDAALKPVMLGRGLPIPVPIILVGVIGGALAAGLVGLLVGPVLLSIGYVLLLEWLGEPLSDEVQP